MQYLYLDIWDLLDSYKIVIPMNLKGPMGRDLAYQAKEKYYDLEDFWKACCACGRAKPGRVIAGEHLILFPVKHHWRDKASLGLIEASLRALAKVEGSIAIPQVGCGFGELNWESEVEPLVRKYFYRRTNAVVVIPPQDVWKKYPLAFKTGTRKDRRGTK